MKQTFLGLFLLFGVLSGCASRPYIFQDAPPIETLQDDQPSPVPEEDRFNIREYMTTSVVRYPLVDHFDFKPPVPSQDVNALDQVPASSWFTPRLGFQKLSPEDLLKGPEDLGPPQKPWVVTKAKKKGTDPGFFIRDGRGLSYLFKLDDPDYPGHKSGANFVVNRLFWGFGYNVPEDFIVEFDQDALQIDPESQMTQEQLEELFWDAGVTKDGKYRATASLMLQGKILGHITQRGTRKGDIHDTIPHQNLRVLRALYVFCALTQNTGIRSDNTLDVYEGEPGQGHTVHYLLDFGESLGLHGQGYAWKWEGYEHYFSWEGLVKNYLKIGVFVKPWERLDELKDPTIYFESETFDPKAWKEVYPFDPIRKSLPEDHYWAAKIIAALNEEHLTSLFQAANYPDPADAERLLKTLLARQDKILESVFAQVTPLESLGVNQEILKLQDLRKTFLKESKPLTYQIQFFDSGRGSLAPHLQLEDVQGKVEIPIAAALQASKEGYLRLEVKALGAEHERAEFHLKQKGDGKVNLIGVVH